MSSMGRLKESTINSASREIGVRLWRRRIYCRNKSTMNRLRFNRRSFPEKSNLSTLPNARNENGVLERRYFVNRTPEVARLNAGAKTVHWGYLDARLPPVLT